VRRVEDERRAAVPPAAKKTGDKKKESGEPGAAHGPRMLAAIRNDYNHMTMVNKVPTVPAGEFKARCLALLDRVAETGEELVVTKRGKPVARLVPVEPPRPLRGSVLWEGDLVSPVGAEWAAEE